MTPDGWLVLGCVLVLVVMLATVLINGNDERW